MTPLLSTYSRPPEDDESRFAYMLDGERAVVEWSNVRNSEKRKISFQVIVTYTTGDIQFVYRDVNDIQGWARMRFPGCENIAGKARRGK